MAHQVLHHLQQIRQGLHAVNHIERRDVAAADSFERLADQQGSVVETGLERQL
jgi:hypothetical protein